MARSPRRTGIVVVVVVVAVLASHRPVAAVIPMRLAKDQQDKDGCPMAKVILPNPLILAILPHQAPPIKRTIVQKKIPRVRLQARAQQWRITKEKLPPLSLID